ncbi:cobalamin adenosyltransferase [Spirochaetia bacterium]|nr:cobalamin adenosyltransferase [Spirochaetia bacterium]
MSISTTRGDDGTTDLMHGERVPKDHRRIVCIGAVDELNAFLGDAKCAAAQERTREIIGIVQGELSSLMGILATVDSDTADGDRGGGVTVPDAGRLTAWVRELEAERPIRGFIVPGACSASAKLDIARAVCRRAERHIITLDRSEPLQTGGTILSYMNRLSDLLFMLARSEEC